MELTNTIENKAKFFALYYGQKVLCIRKNESPLLYVGFDDLQNNKVREEDYLELTPLSQITDEDFIEIAKICEFWIGSALRFDRNEKRIAMYSVYNDEPLKRTTLFLHYKDTLEIFLLNEDKQLFQYDLSRLLEITDYLRSKGYYIGDGTEVSFGWIKLKEATNEH